jgi:hypothetical protein
MGARLGRRPSVVTPLPVSHLNEWLQHYSFGYVGEVRKHHLGLHATMMISRSQSEWMHSAFRTEMHAKKRRVDHPYDNWTNADKQTSTGMGPVKGFSGNSLLCKSHDRQGLAGSEREQSRRTDHEPHTVASVTSQTTSCLLRRTCTHNVSPALGARRAQSIYPSHRAPGLCFRRANFPTLAVPATIRVCTTIDNNGGRTWRVLVL